MTALRAGLLCTSMLIGTCACLWGCISAAVHKLRRAQILHGVMLLVNFLLLSVMLAQLTPGEGMTAQPWTAIAVLLPGVSTGALLVQLVWNRRHLSQVSIQTSCDHLPSALCFALKNGRPCMRNLKMDELSHQLLGEELSDANLFWNALGEPPVVTLANGQTWSFERTAMELDGQAVYQIVGTEVTEKMRLNRALEEENRRLTAMNRRLRAYSQQVQTLTREKEALCAKVRIHSEWGRMLLETRRFLDDGCGEAATLCASWRQSIRFLLGEETDAAPSDSFDQLRRAAQAIGASIHRYGVFPNEGTETAQLVAAAAHECLTNLVRHAGGTRLEIQSVREADGWHICFRNDGTAPAGPIVAGGGLSSLRERVEAAGGVMAVDHAPRFLLTLVLPEERERCFE